MRIPFCHELICYFLVVLICSSATAQESGLDFARDIRPIFSNKCFVCHGPDAKTREGGFRLDQRESAFGEADSGETPISPGNLQQSEIIRRVQSTDSDRMPPHDAEQQLTPEEIDRIKRWIEQGAVWEQHWAFVAPQKPELPPVLQQDWPKNPIDHFVLAKLDANGESPSAEAKRETLIRRLSLDLIGLPPTPQEVEEFLNDESSSAYERLVDQLLSSPRYGEHRASACLDAARFADTNGYQNDFSRSMWPWRDWVINAFNQNMPFDQFAIEQLAGDLLPNPTDDQRIATGFNRNHRTVTEGGSIEAEWHVENLVDRVETTSTVFLGLTMGCARCHDHKFDPISQREFYQFYSFFNSINEKGVHNERRGNVPPLMKIHSPKHHSRLARVDEQIKQAEANLESIKLRLVERQEAWEKDLNNPESESISPKHVVGLLQGNARPKPELVARHIKRIRESNEIKSELTGPAIKLVATKTTANEESLSLGNAFDFDGTKPFTCSVWVKPEKYGAIISRMDAANVYRGFDMLISPDGRMDVHLIHDWPGNAVKIHTNDPIPRQRWTHVAVAYDGSGKAKGFKVYFNNRPIDFKVNSDTLDGSTLTDHPFWIGRRGNSPSFGGLITDLRIFDKYLDTASIGDCFDAALVQIMQRSKTGRTSGQQADIDHLFLSSSNEEHTKAQRQLEGLRQKRREIEKSVPTVMIMEEMVEPRMTYVLRRGQYDQPMTEDPVTPGLPAFLPEPAVKNGRMNRLDLARWLTDQKNPLMARVTVNRFWNQIFGVGLLDTIENFGVQSTPPSHQALLDWLAIDFMEAGWDVKRLQKQMVMSATYRQSSFAGPEAFRRDPLNRLLARGSRFRLPAESIRDNALAISGLLDPQIGGESMKPYQPEGLWQELAGGAGEKPYVQVTDKNLYRRSLYIYRKRTVPHSTMSTFDAASRDVCQVARQRTNTPLQALALLNDTTYAEAARQLATLIMLEDRAPENRLVNAFRRATSRKPNRRELAMLKRSLDRSLEWFGEQPESASQYISVGESKVDTSLDEVELAAYTIVASVILNLDETISRE